VIGRVVGWLVGLKFNLKNQKEDLINELTFSTVCSGLSRKRKMENECLLDWVAACYLLSVFFSLASWNRFFTALILDF
jgi:hypothetical protein